MPEVVGLPALLDAPDAPEVEVSDELDGLGVEPVVESEDVPAPVVPEVPLVVAGVPEVPVEPGTFSAPGVR